MKLEIADDLVYVEIGRTLSDNNYGNWKLSVRVPCRSNDIDQTIEAVRTYIEGKTKEWIDIERAS